MPIIADPAVVRSLAGNRSTDILPDADITKAIEFSDSLVQTATNKTTWDTSDPAYGVIKQASEYFASSSILSRWQDAEDDSTEQWTRGDYLLKSVVANLSTATGGEDLGGILNITTGEDKTSPLNPNAPYRRPNGRSIIGSGGEGVERLYRYDY